MSTDGNLPSIGLPRSHGFRSNRSTVVEYLESSTLRHSLLSARFKQSFAYLTLSSRIPSIMQQIVNHFIENKEKLIEQYGEEVLHDIRKIRDKVEQLRLELQSDRQLKLFSGAEPDKQEWNLFIKELPRPKRTYFRACWLHSECYLYRKLYSFIENSKLLKGYDFFSDLKENDVQDNILAMEVLATCTRKLEKSFEIFAKLMRLDLWSNRYELQIAQCKREIFQRIWKDLSIWDKYILVNESSDVWNCLSKANLKNANQVIVDFVCDNAGFEFFVDMLFLEYLLDHKLASKVRLHVKAIPWYISDLTKNDIFWLIGFLKDISYPILNTVARKWETMLAENKVEVAPTSYFWTGPQSYFVMFDSNTELYMTLAQSDLIIFKGDLNYRKLMGDYIWDPSEEFITCLRGFRPTNICAIRTIKSEVVCGLPEGKAEYLLRTDPQWMISGKYGLIQYTDSLKCRCYLNDGLPKISSKKEKVQVAIE